MECYGGEGASWEETPATEYLLGVRPQLQPMPLPQLPYTILIFMHTSIHADIHAHTHAHMHAYTHVHTRAHIGQLQSCDHPGAASAPLGSENSPSQEEFEDPGLGGQGPW